MWMLLRIIPAVGPRSGQVIAGCCAGELPAVIIGDTFHLAPGLGKYHIKIIGIDAAVFHNGPSGVPGSGPAGFRPGALTYRRQGLQNQPGHHQQ
jgi:hypothetical protein